MSPIKRKSKLVGDFETLKEGQTDEYTIMFKINEMI